MIYILNTLVIIIDGKRLEGHLFATHLNVRNYFLPARILVPRILRAHLSYGPSNHFVNSTFISLRLYNSGRSIQGRVQILDSIEFQGVDRSHKA